ncbi:YciI family protein [uncultured Lutibacter sp.]|uniref:YciI family protein n=1 Tax=uncultured Lutibacter sp. TaxID=437739 RepID=UPI00260E763F|nr:YciI family protein [uncultured Lutibacter sp.]
MKKIIFLWIACVLVMACNNDLKKTNINSNTFDEELAKEIGADDYGMKKYVIAFLKRGPNKSQDSTTASNLQRAHMDNISKLAKEGKLVLAGPFFGNDDLRGIYIFNTSTIEEAKQLTETDPAIKAGTLTMELKEWYGSAALMLLNDFHKKVTKIEI